MATSTLLIIIAVAVVAVLVAVAVAVVLVRRSREQRRVRAGQLRELAVVKGGGVDAARQVAAQAEAEAKVRRVEANRAEAVAEQARTDLAHELAAQEDIVREADRVDPGVNTRRKDYTPETVATGTDTPSETPVENAPVTQPESTFATPSEAPSVTPPDTQSTGGAHRA